MVDFDSTPHCDTFETLRYAFAVPLLGAVETRGIGTSCYDRLELRGRVKAGESHTFNYRPSALFIVQLFRFRFLPFLHHPYIHVIISHATSFIYFPVC